MWHADFEGTKVLNPVLSPTGINILLSPYYCFFYLCGTLTIKTYPSYETTLWCSSAGSAACCLRK